MGGERPHGEKGLSASSASVPRHQSVQGGREREDSVQLYEEMGSMLLFFKKSIS